MIKLKYEFWNSFKYHSGWMAEMFIIVLSNSHKFCNKNEEQLNVEMSQSCFVTATDSVDIWPQTQQEQRFNSWINRNVS